MDRVSGIAVLDTDWNKKNYLDKKTAFTSAMQAMQGMN